MTAKRPPQTATPELVALRRAAKAALAKAQQKPARPPTPSSTAASWTSPRPNPKPAALLPDPQAPFACYLHPRPSIFSRGVGFRSVRQA